MDLKNLNNFEDKSLTATRNKEEQKEKLDNLKSKYGLNND
jgi:hypothetical protein